MAEQDTPLWLFADQLGRHFHGGEHEHRRILLVEASSALARRRFHRQKLHLILSALRHAKADLGERATLLRADTYTEALRGYGRPVLVHEPTSHAAERFVHRLRDAGLVADILPTPAFALSRAEFGHWAGERTRFRMEDFYRDQRRRFSVMMVGTDPVGGRWNFDADNRESPPKGVNTLEVPPPYRPAEDGIDAGVRRDLDGMGIDTVGADGPRLFAVTPTEAGEALSQFIGHRLALFGRYEDAILGADWAMAHSLLSVPLNLGLLHPLDVVHAAESAYRDGSAPLAATEGFIRQILGWREFVRGIYMLAGPGYTSRNALGHTRPLPAAYWGAETRMACLSDVVRATRQNAYAHHIQRLMVTGNFALLAGIDPAEVHEWYLSVYADAFEWVEAPNTLGMSQFADGGKVASKPYVSSGAYIDRMSDYCGGCAYDVKERSGETACPFNPLYWHFLNRHRDRFAANPRMGPVYSNLDRMDGQTRAAILARAEAILDAIEAGRGP